MPLLLYVQIVSCFFSPFSEKLYLKEGKWLLFHRSPGSVFILLVFALRYFF